MITAAAAIMVAVFGAFVLSGEVFLKLIGPPRVRVAPSDNGASPACGGDVRG